MKYKEIQNLSPSKFKRLCGVRLETFNEMITIVKNYFQKHKKTGRPSKLSIEDQILMTLEYLREYRTYFHIGQSWGLDESNVYRTIKKIENILIQCEAFQLPGKSKLLTKNNETQVVVVKYKNIT
jgi:hypothetical protein